MGFDLLNLEPTKVSRDLSGYITYIYGVPKVGKTTFGTQMPKSLLIAFEKGYNALGGIKAVDINTWGEFKALMRELKKPEVQEVYKSLIIDTIDVAAALCDKYICNQLGIENLGDGGWTVNGWAKYKKEFEDAFRSLTMMGYAVLFISHSQDKSFKKKDGTEYNQVVPTAQKSVNDIAKAMADIYACADIVNGERKLILRSVDGEYDVGCRFKYIEPVINFSYQDLVNALNTAIDKEATETQGKYVTDERVTINSEPTYNYDELIEEFNNLISPLMMKNEAYYRPRIASIVEKYLGRGKKIGDTTPSQAEFIYLINTEIKEDLVK